MPENQRACDSWFFLALAFAIFTAKILAGKIKKVNNNRYEGFISCSAVEAMSDIQIINLDYPENAERIEHSHIPRNVAC